MMGGWMRWKTHSTIGTAVVGSVLAISELTGHRVTSANVSLNDLAFPIVLVVGLVVAAKASPLPDKLEDSLGLRHRGPAHSLVACAAMALIGSLMALATRGTSYAVLVEAVVWPTIWAYSLHIAADMLTDNGVELFWPNKERHLICRLWYYSDSERPESMVQTGALLVLIPMVLWSIFRWVSMLSI